jgi:solute carrier family 8 (sodium/calcium exchanger)
LEIVDDNQWEPDEEFFVKLTLIPQESENVRLGRTSIMEITILNDDGKCSNNNNNEDWIAGN